jgi:amino acid transporter
VTHGQRTDVAPELGEHDSPMLQQKMKPRHLQMIAVGGSIGTGLFVSFVAVLWQWVRVNWLTLKVGSGSALTRGGPAGVLIAWIIMGEHSHATDEPRPDFSRCHVGQCHSGSR